MNLHVRLRSNKDGSEVAELVNRSELITLLQQTIARGIHQEHCGAYKPYDPDEPQYSDKPHLPTSKEFEHLKAEFSDDERMRVRSPGRVPREVKIPAGTVNTGFTDDVIKGELLKLLPEFRQLNIRIVIDP